MFEFHFCVCVCIYIYIYVCVCVCIFVILSSAMDHVPDDFGSFRISIRSGQSSIPRNRGIFER